MHSEDQSVLGVLDIVYPLDKIDSTIRANTLTIVGLALGFVVAAALMVSLLVHRVVYRPLRDLEDGAAKIAEGELRPAGNIIQQHD
jgi:nitrogen fixation/metabolism regulation signal transduction histidine kinase